MNTYLCLCILYQANVTKLTNIIVAIVKNDWPNSLIRCHGYHIKIEIKYHIKRNKKNKELYTV